MTDSRVEAQKCCVAADDLCDARLRNTRLGKNSLDGGVVHSTTKPRVEQGRISAGEHFFSPLFTDGIEPCVPCSLKQVSKGAFVGGGPIPQGGF